MRKTKELLITLTLGLMFAAAVSVPTKADTEIKVGKEYKINLDGKGKKEKIVVKKVGEEDGVRKYELRINGNVVKSIEGYYDAECKVIDIQKNKKGKELVFTGRGASDTHSNTFGIYKYKKGKLTKIAGSKFKTYNFCRVPDVRTDGKGKVYMTIDTPVDVGNGCYFGEIVFKMKNGKLKVVNKYQIKMVNGSEKHTFEVNKKIKVYKKATKKSKKIDTLKKGEKITIIKVKFSNVDRTSDWPYRAGTAFAYIKDENGNKGWIKLKDYRSLGDNNQFVEYPEWG